MSLLVYRARGVANMASATKNASANDVPEADMGCLTTLIRQPIGG